MGSTDDSAKVFKTKRLLAGQLMELLEHKPFKKITVNDICQSAMVSRSTFYLHFTDKYELFRYCLERELERLEALVHETNITSFITAMLDSLLEKKSFYYNTLVAESDQEIIDIFEAYFCRFFAVRIEERQRAGHEPVCNVDIASAFYAGGVTAANIRWIKGNFAISKEEMAECQRRLLSDLLD